MKRDSNISNVIRTAYDELLVNDKAFYDVQPNNLKKGLFIDPFISSAKAQKVESFIHQYDGSNNDKIISVSDVFCQKLYAICCVSAKLLIVGGVLKDEHNGNLITDLNYHITKKSFKEIVKESEKYLRKQMKIAENGDKDFSDKIICDILNCANQYIGNSDLNLKIAQIVTTSAIKMLILHEYFHIINKDTEQTSIDERKRQEKKADIDAFNRLKEKENNIASYVGAICLQSSGLFLNVSLESITHPDVDNRIEYIYDICDQEEEGRIIFRDVLKLYVNLWARINKKGTDFLRECKDTTPKKIFDFLKKEKARQNHKRLEEGRKEMKERTKMIVEPKYL